MSETERKRLSEPPRTESGFVEDMATPAQALSLKELLEPHAGAWVTFRKDLEPRLEGNYSNHITPEAIYGLDVDQISREAERYSKFNTLKRHASYFHNIGYVRRPAAVVFKVDGRSINAETYSEFSADWQRLGDYVAEKYPSALPIVDRWMPKRTYDPYLGLKAIIWLTEQTADEIVGSEYWGDTFKHHPHKPAKWRELLCAIGVDAVEDRINFLTGDCGHQVAVVNPDAISVLASFDNPATSPAPMRDESNAGLMPKRW